MTPSGSAPRSWAPRLLAFSPVLVLLAVLAASWGLPVLEEHGFRQTQTLLSAYWMTQGGSWWLYQTPVLGYPWVIPFEFPLYQWGVALLAMAPLGLDVDAAGRVLSTLAMVGCVWPLRQALRGFDAPERLVDLATALFLLSPLHLFWGRAAMIESTVLLLSLAFVVAVQRLVLGVTVGRLLSAVGFAVLAALVKVTTFFAFALLAGGVVAVALAVRLRARDLRGAASLALAAGLPVALAMAALLGWLHASDQMKMGSVLAEFTTSNNLSGWNFDRKALGMPEVFWRDTVWRRMLPDILGHAVWLAPLGLLLMAQRRWRWLAWSVVLLALFMAPLLVFTNLHFVHNYYQMANGTFLVVALAVLLHALSEHRRAAVAAALGGLAAVGMLVQFHGGYWQSIQRFDPNHRSLLVAQVLRQHTAPDDVVVTMGLTWSSEVPYYATRRAVMLMQDEFQPFVADLLQAPDGQRQLTLGAVVRCGATRSDITALTPLMPGPLQEIEVGGCSIVARRDASSSDNDQVRSAPAAAVPAAAPRDPAGPVPAAADGPLLPAPLDAQAPDYREVDSCNVEFVGTGSTPAVSFARAGSLTVAGWFLEKPTMARPARPMLRMQAGAAGRSWFAPIDIVESRDDLVAAFGPEAARAGGFRITVPLSALPPGRYQLALVDQAGDSPALCVPYGKTVIVY